jgi:hypothetical protein
MGLKAPEGKYIFVYDLLYCTNLNGIINLEIIHIFEIINSINYILVLPLSYPPPPEIQCTFQHNTEADGSSSLLVHYCE